MHTDDLGTAKAYTPDEYARDLQTVPGYFFLACERFPSRPAQRYNAALYHGDNNGRFTYTEMRRRVDDIACGLLSIGLNRQERVGLMSRSSPYWTQADMAIAACAAVSVAVHSTLSPGDAAYILRDSGCRFLFIDSEENLGRILPGIDGLPDLERVVVMDFGRRGQDERTIGLWDLMEQGREWGKHNDAAYQERRQGVSLDDWYTIVHTSGTAGASKAVVLTHWSVSSRLEGMRDFLSRHGMKIWEDDVALCCLPLSNLFERISCQLLAAFAGACIAYSDNPSTLLDDMQWYNPTWINCVPRLYEKIYHAFRKRIVGDPVKKAVFDLAFHVGRKALDYRRDHRGCYNMSPEYRLQERLPLMLKLQYRLADRLFSQARSLFGSRLRFAFSAGSGIARDLLIFFYTLGVAVVEGYGCAESSCACILNPVTACKPGCIGIEAGDSLVRTAPDGELEISGAGMFSHYLNLPGDAGEPFTRDGWFKTGDVVMRDDYGYYRIVDRKEAVICTAKGKNVAPAKLENLFALSGAIEQVFIIGDERPYVSALIVPNFDYFIDLFEQERIPYDKGAVRYSEIGGVRACTEVGGDIVNHPRLRDLIEHEVAVVNRRLESFERIRRFTVLPRRFTEEDAMLTPTQKIRRAAVLGDFTDLIEAMY